MHKWYSCMYFFQDPSVVSFLAARKSKASAAEKPNTPSMETGEQDKHSETSKHINEPYAKAIPRE